jgi:GNAT superfamily N-acetyltransferase
MKNNDRIELIKNAREKSFTDPILEKYYFESVPIEKFWDTYANEFHIHSPLELFFEEDKLRSNIESDKLKLINNPSNIYLIEDNYLLIDEDKKVIAMMRGWQKNFDSYYMQFTAVHSDYRKKGIYSLLVDRVLEYTKLLGFSRVLSCHAPFNNAVLIAKLKKDFKIIGMDVDAALGINVWLCYFHNNELKRAFELRCGNLTFSKKLFSSSLGTAEKLYEALNKART